MKKVLFVLVALLVIFVLVNRDRIFVRDPFGKVTRNGVREQGAQVYINYPNQVLLENDNAPMYVEILIPGVPIGAPKHLTCLHWVVCMTDAKHPELGEANPGAYIESMTEMSARFKDTGDKETVVALR